MSARRVASPLHAARASAAAAYGLAFAAAALLTDHPVVLGALGACVGGAALLSGAAPAVGRALRFAVPLSLVIALINPFVSRNGLTVFARLGEVPPFGQVDLTVEALVYGLVFGLRVLVVMAASALFTATVDPDELLRLFRRVSSRSALTAVLATRMVPLLARDARRLDDARRCRADGGGRGPAARLAVLRAVTTGALERSLDVAATLEVRGYGRARALRGRDALRAPWSRHDVAFALAAAAIVGIVVLARVAGAARFAPYPTIELTSGPAEAAVVVALLGAALAPFADRRGVGR